MESARSPRSIIKPVVLACIAFTREWEFSPAIVLPSPNPAPTLSPATREQKPSQASPRSAMRFNAGAAGSREAVRLRRYDWAAGM